MAPPKPGHREARDQVPAAMIAHFDGDLLVYRAGFAAEKMHYYVSVDGDDEQHFDSAKQANDYIASLALGEEQDALVKVDRQRHVEPVANALHNVKSLVTTALSALGLTPDDMVMYLSGPDNFRNGVAKLRPYKGNRDEAHKPVHGPAIKEYLQRTFNTKVSVNEEADDMVAYSHYRLYVQDPYSSIIISTDKDLNMVPGLHYNFVRDEQYYVDDDAATRFFQMQLLTGDSTDNIVGVPGLGKKKAEALLDGVDIEGGWLRVAEAYKASYDKEWYDALIENGRLLWMRREPDEWWLPPLCINTHEEETDDKEVIATG